MNISKVVKTLVGVDFAVNSAFGLFGPVFAIFLSQNLVGGNIEVAGFATAVYWMTKSVFQLPIAHFLDEKKGENDDFYALIGGYFGGSLAIFLYTFAVYPMHVYLIQALLGISMAFAVPAWYGIFTRHIDKFHESFEWSLESVFSVGVATALSGALGGIIASRFGFTALFLTASIISFLGSISLIFLKKHLLPKDHFEKIIRPPIEKGQI